VKGKKWGIVLLAAVGLMVVAPALAAPVDARLDGKFAVTVTITGGDGPPPVGTKLKRVYKFKSSCPGKGSCPTVDFYRQTSTGNFVKTTLTKVETGVYEGTEVQDDPLCANGDPASARTGDIHVETTDKDGKLASKINGTTHFDVVGCDETFQDGTFKGKLK
jgi:hypothetical protein